MNPYSYMDPGLTGTSFAPGMSGQQYDAPTQSNSDPANWMNNAGQAWLNYRLSGRAPEPGAFDSPGYMSWFERNASDMIPGSSGIAGPVRAIKEPMQGGLRTVLQYYKDTNPAKTLGELTYSKPSGGAPLFENIISGTPRGTGELFDSLTKRLGGTLNSMELTPIQPNAAPQFEKLANSQRFPSYAPDLKQRILNEVDRVRNVWGSLPENSYQSNPYKAMGFWDK